jgi:hypothetical protein
VALADRQGDVGAARRSGWLTAPESLTSMAGARRVTENGVNVQVFDAADQKVTEQGDMVLLELWVDADEPADGQCHVRLLAPVKIDSGQYLVRRVEWRGNREVAGQQ